MVRKSSRNAARASHIGDVVPVFGNKRESLGDAHSEQSRMESGDIEEPSDLPNPDVLEISAESARLCIDTTVGDQDAVRTLVRNFVGLETLERQLTQDTSASALHDICVKQNRVYHH